MTMRGCHSAIEASARILVRPKTVELRPVRDAVMNHSKRVSIDEPIGVC